MKNIPLKLIISVLLLLSMTSCFTYTATIGEGAQGNEEVRKMNPYFVNGLIAGNISDPNELAGGAENYNLEVKQRFVDLFLGAVTFGIYTPTTTIVTK